MNEEELTPEQQEYLKGLPRQTLQERIDYWQAWVDFHELNLKAKRVRPYAPEIGEDDASNH
jgi:uncharacterized membrane protein